MLKTVYLELQEIKANSEAILFSIHQLEAWLDRQNKAQMDLDFTGDVRRTEKSPEVVEA